MSDTYQAEAPPRLVLGAQAAGDLMTPNPVSIRDTATIREAVALLTDKGFSAAPVIDEAGRPVGVVSRGDILVHEREKVGVPGSVPDYYAGAELAAQAAELPRGQEPAARPDPTRVADLMTPAVFSVAPETPAAKVVEEMMALHIHRLFVVDHGGVLVGVISALDVLRHLQPEQD